MKQDLRPSQGSRVHGKDRIAGPKSKPGGDPDGRDELIIALDFGTTYSGVAYGRAKDQAIDPQTIARWPGNTGRDPPRVPSVLAYDAQDKTQFAWGYRANGHGARRIEGIKLLLDPDQSKRLHAPPSETEAQLQELGKTAVEVTTDYLRAIHQHAMERLEIALPREYLGKCRKKYVLSVPAVWSDKAQDNTKRAAEAAGMHPVTLIKEPEAAALYSLTRMRDQAMKVGDAFVLCDAGGGTVDLVSYEVTKLKPLKLKELVGATGGLAGSLMLNQRFERYLQGILGDETFRRVKATRDFENVMIDFDEKVKRAYMGDADEEHGLHFCDAELPDLPACGITNRRMKLKGGVLDHIFSSVFDEIKTLVAGQVDLVTAKRSARGRGNGSRVQAIILVGGFGSNEYLRKVLQGIHRDIQVIQPDDAWSAIAKGAVMSQFPGEASVDSIVAMKSYGLQTRIKPEAEKSAQDKFLDEFDLCYKVFKMSWHIHKGDDLQRGRKIFMPITLRRMATCEDDDFVFRVVLRESDAGEPSSDPKESKPNCEVKADLRQVPRNRFSLKRNSKGLQYYAISFKVVVIVGSGPMTFSVEFDGKELDKTEVIYQ